MQPPGAFPVRVTVLDFPRFLAAAPFSGKSPAKDPLRPATASPPHHSPDLDAPESPRGLSCSYSNQSLSDHPRSRARPRVASVESRSSPAVVPRSSLATASERRAIPGPWVGFPPSMLFRTAPDLNCFRVGQFRFLSH
jgi:hypothetical protein